MLQGSLMKQYFSAALLQNVCKHLSFKRKMACKRVCRAWRDVLRCSPSQAPSKVASSNSVWGPATIIVRREASLAVRADAHSRGIVVCSSEASFSGLQAAFLAWLRQRAAGVKHIQLILGTKETGWILPQLVMTLHSCNLSCPLVSLRTGKPLRYQ